MVKIMAKIKPIIGTILIVSSYVLGIAFWLFSLLVALNQAGMIWMIVGILFAGVGVVFVAAAALIIKGFFLDAIFLAACVVVIYLIRISGTHLLNN